MNLSVHVLLITGLATLCLAGFRPRPIAPTATTPVYSDFMKRAPVPHREVRSGARQTLYYFYTFPYDFYNDRKTLADEEYELWVLYGYPFDTSPSGGTLLMKGYFNNAYPHNQLPMVLLYGHFPFLLK